jgi:hypothetical protein
MDTLSIKYVMISLASAINMLDSDYPDIAKSRIIEAMTQLSKHCPEYTPGNLTNPEYMSVSHPN